ncbi:hypothetical protein ACEVJK_08515 [Flintibacter sp. P01028]|uniref:hypothetical protein n=1 Tax=Eubacteriales TaxID=186802 RepID=UPI0035B67FA7
MLKVLCGSDGWYHSRAARDDRAGAFPLQEVTSGKLSRFACSRRAGLAAYGCLPPARLR